MSRPQSRRIAAFLITVLATTPCLWATESRARSRPPGPPAGTAALLESAAQAWWAVVASWVSLAQPAVSKRHVSHGGRTGFGPTPTCDAGATIDPSGHCLPRSARRPELLPTCDAGPLIDPNGSCPGH